MQRIKPAIGEIYHVYNRGVEKRKIFMGDKDYLRFLYNLLIFNDSSPALNAGRLLVKKINLIEVRLQSKLVEIVALCLMPNHFHLMVKQTEENGLSEFMRKLGTGYTNYFNLKYQRVGPLFQGAYKFALIKEQRHFIYLPHYIHLNPLDLIEPKWREEGIKNIKRAMDFLKKYRWSSYCDYLGENNFSAILNKTQLTELFNTQNYEKDIEEWLEAKKLNEIGDIILEND